MPDENNTLRRHPRSASGVDAAWRDATYASALERPAPTPLADRVVIIGSIVAAVALCAILLAETLARYG